MSALYRKSKVELEHVNFVSAHDKLFFSNFTLLFQSKIKITCHPCYRLPSTKDIYFDQKMHVPVNEYKNEERERDRERREKENRFLCLYIYIKMKKRRKEERKGITEVYDLVYIHGP